MVWAFVVANSLDAREAQGESRAVLRALLDFVIGDFDDDLRSYGDCVAVIVLLERLKPSGHLDELLVGEAFKSFAHRRVTAGVIGHSEVII